MINCVIQRISFFVNWNNFGSFKLLRKSSRHKIKIDYIIKWLRRNIFVILRKLERILVGPVAFSS